MPISESEAVEVEKEAIPPLPPLLQRLGTPRPVPRWPAAGATPAIGSMPTFAMPLWPRRCPSHRAAGIGGGRTSLTLTYRPRRPVVLALLLPSSRLPVVEVQKHPVEGGRRRLGGMTTTSVQDPMDLVPAAVWAFGPHPAAPLLPLLVLRIVIAEIAEIEVVGLHLRVSAEKAEEEMSGGAEAQAQTLRLLVERSHRHRREAASSIVISLDRGSSRCPRRSHWPRSPARDLDLVPSRSSPPSACQDRTTT